MTVYKPGEDTYLVLNYLDGIDLEGKRFLDMGTGNGEIALKAAEKGAEVVAVDVNPEALEYAEEKAVDRGLEDRIDFLKSDLFENLEGSFDIVSFNPPYLPGEKGIGDEEIWWGGETGVELSKKFLHQVPDFLSSKGFALLVGSSRADLQALSAEFDLEVVDQVSLWFEELKLLRFG